MPRILLTTLDVLSHDHQRTVRFGNRLQHRKHVADIADFLVVQKDERILELNALALLVVDEIRREITAIELHALDDVELVLERRAFLNRDNAFLADFFHRIGNDAADRFIGIGRDRADLGNRLRIGARLRQLLEFGDQISRTLVDTTLEIHRVHAGCNGLEALTQDSLGQHGGGGGTVTGDVGGLRCDLFHHLRTHVLELVFQLDFLGDRNAVLRDGRGAEALLEHDIAALGTESYLYGIRQDVDAAHHVLAGIIAEADFLYSHFQFLTKFIWVKRIAWLLCDRPLRLDHGHDVFLTHDQQIFAFNLDFGAAVLAKQHCITDLDVQRTDFAAFQDFAVANGHDLALDGLFGCGVGNNDSAGGGTFLLHAFDDHAIMQWANLHVSALLKLNS
jgi:hypothetical protein